MGSDEMRETRELLGQLEGLAQVETGTAESERAVVRARAAVLEVRKVARRRFFMRLVIPTGVAAALVVAGVVGFLAEFPRKASAAEQLDAVVQATKAYKGWMHMHPLFAADAKYSNGWLSAERKDVYENTADGSWGTMSQSGGEFFSNSRLEWSDYLVSKNQIEIAALPEQPFFETHSPTTVAEALARYKSEMGRDPISIKETADGKLTRFDITLFASQEEARKYSVDHHKNYMGQAISLWINHDHLIARMTINAIEGPMTYDIFYGPEIHDIYDLGAPRSAKVIDFRLKPEFAAVMDRLDGRAAKGFGDYTAFLWEYDLDETGKSDGTGGLLTLYARQEKQWLYMEYRLFHVIRPGQRERPGLVLQEAPAGWPTPDFEKFLPMLHEAAPTYYGVLNGDRGWSGSLDSMAHAYLNARATEPKMHLPTILAVGVESKIWPSRHWTAISFMGTKAEMLKDNDHPNLVGLHYKRVSTQMDDDEDRDDVSKDNGSTWWFDPARDDMPVEHEWSRSDGNGNTVSAVETHFLDYGQLANGQWYPARWQEKRSDVSARTGKKSEGTTEYRLVILPKLKLDDSWFQQPRPKYFEPRAVP